MKIKCGLIRLKIGITMNFQKLKLFKLHIRKDTSRSKWPRLRSASGFGVIDGRGEKWGCAPFFSPPQPRKPTVTELGP